jgi:release factor glutamine methyltransferase
MNIAEAIIFGSRKLSDHNIAEPRREASSLLEICLNKDRAFLISHDQDVLEPKEFGQYILLVERRSDGEPFHYIAGEKEFYGLFFKVDRSVLIPRPETEMLVESSIEFLNEINSPKFCEIGTGSGCIAISILHNARSATAIACDISEDALRIAHANAERHLVSDRLELVKSNVFNNISGNDFDLIVSNPPYIPARDVEELDIGVRGFEPHIALTDNGNGLSILEKIISEAPKHLRIGGMIMLEFGIGQSEDLLDLFNTKLWRNIQINADLRSIPRTISAELISRNHKSLPFLGDREYD